MSGTPGAVSFRTVWIRLLWAPRRRERACRTAGRRPEKRRARLPISAASISAVMASLILGIRKRPAGVHARLTHRLDHRRAHALGIAQSSLAHRAHSLLQQLARPAAEQQLVEQVLIVAVRHAAGDSRIGRRAAQDARPDRQLPRPFLRRTPTAPPGARAHPRRAWCRGSRWRASRAASAARAADWRDGTRRACRRSASGSPPTSLSAMKRLIAIERRVLDALGDHRTAVLLQPHRAAQQRLAREAAARLLHQLRRQHLLEKIEYARIDLGLVAPRLRERPAQIALIGAIERRRWLSI